MDFFDSVVNDLQHTPSKVTQRTMRDAIEDVADHITFTEAEIENKVASVAAGHKMAGFDVTDEDREIGRAIISGELDADVEVARLVAEAKAANAPHASERG